MCEECGKKSGVGIFKIRKTGELRRAHIFLQSKHSFWRRPVSCQLVYLRATEKNLNWPQCCRRRGRGVLCGVRVRVDLRGDSRRGGSSQGETIPLSLIIRTHRQKHKHADKHTSPFLLLINMYQHWLLHRCRHRHKLADTIMPHTRY